jgi:ferredoxin
METSKVTLISFSPTGTTQKVLESIARGIAAKEVEQVNLTLPKGVPQVIPPFSDELVLIGAPVYGGRLPGDAVKRFTKLHASETPAVLVVLYGNRDFEDALLELRNLSRELGFVAVAAGAFVGEHSFSSEDLPTAKGRPDSEDIQKAIDFGAAIRKKAATLPSIEAMADVDIPGRFPYESGGARPMAVSPVTREDTCTLCGTCAGVCPTAAITVEERVSTATERCIRCCACIKKCPAGARVMEDDRWKGIATWLHENCSARKEPELFGVAL